MDKNVIGHIDCPVCGFAHAEVKPDKNGHAFAFCTDCATQVFTRNAYRDGHLRKRMRPVTVTVTEDKAPVQTELAEKKAAPEPVKKPPAAPAVKTPQKTSSSWLRPLLAGGGDE